jgi:DNA-binding transcriptional regulator GbsR (MarR family)/nucleoside-triphosphatase THEP1
MVNFQQDFENFFLDKIFIVKKVDNKFIVNYNINVNLIFRMEVMMAVNTTIGHPARGDDGGIKMLQTRFNFPAIYNPANQTKEELIANFVVRMKEFNTIFDVIKKDEMKTPPQHFIIQGPRGSGKTTLLLRLFYAVVDDKKLEKFLIPVIFDEEQYNIRTLFKLWEEIALYLEEEHESLFHGLYDEMQKYIEKVDYEEICFNRLQKHLQESKRKLVLFIDNFGDMLAKFRRKERQRLREVLIQCSDIRIVGGSSVMLEFYYDYSEPFFEFFKVIPLEGLNQKETEELLLQLSETYETETVKQIVKSNPGRIEALRRLTGGVPRTIILLFEIFLDHEKGDSFQDLEIILDRVTPLYKHRMDGLPSQKQDIIDTIALNWDAVGVKEIARNTRISSKAVSAHLNELEKNRIIVKIPTSTKNNLYQVAERFFNIWYLMRHGRKRERKKVLWLVRFLESWCSEEDLISRAKKHIAALKTGTIFEKHALYITEALADTKIPEEVQYQLIKDTREYLTQKNSPYIKELSKSDKELFDEAEKHYEANEFELSLKKLLKIRNRNPLIYFKIGALYDGKIKDNKKAVEYYLMAVEEGHCDAMLRLANLYFGCGDFKKAEKYYLMVVEKGNRIAMNNIAWLYFIEKRNKIEALNLIQNSYEYFKHFLSATFYSIILLWNNEIEEALRMINVFMKDEEVIYSNAPLDLVLMFLMAKKQFHFTYKLFKENKFEIKDKFKPIYYALIYFMRDTYPDEYRKMGAELRETVEEIIKTVNQLAIDYK